MRILIAAASILGMLGTPVVASAQSRPAGETSQKPTIVLVHGAFAGSSSWNAVITHLASDGYPVIAAANPLRGLKSDAAYVSSIVENVKGPVVLVGHSYGGGVVSAAAVGHSNVKALVFVAGFALEVGESPASLGAQFPTGTLGPTLAPPVPLADGSSDLYILQSRYWRQFAADVPEGDAVQMAATQRPIVQTGLTEQAASESWHTLPSWFIWGSLDRNIPAALHAHMAKRAKARDAIEIKGASHVVMISHHRAVADMIVRAATAN